jgi:hypothetical protein
VFAQFASLAHGIHYFAEQVRVGKVLCIPARKAFTIFCFEALYFPNGDSLEVIAHHTARFELLTVNKDGVGTV